MIFKVKKFDFQNNRSALIALDLFYQLKMSKKEGITLNTYFHENNVYPLVIDNMFYQREGGRSVKNKSS